MHIVISYYRHTEMNTESSRSHAILQLVVEQRPEGGRDGRVIRSKLNFVDLAGSERWNKGVDMGQVGRVGTRFPCSARGV